MASLGVALLRLLKGLWRGMGDAEFRAIALLLALTVFGGTLFYHGAEGWSWIDSAYFSVMILTTTGHPALAPTSDFAKLFSIVYMLAASA